MVMTPMPSQPVSSKKFQPTKTTFRNLLHQDILMAQGSHQIRLALWGDLVDKVEQDKSYTVSPVRIRTGDATFLTTTPNSEIMPSADVPVTLDKLQDEDTQQTYMGRLISVSSMSAYYQCPSCQHQVKSPPEDDLLTCDNCRGTTLVDFCAKNVSVKAIFQTHDDSDTFPIVLFLDTVQTVIPNFVTLEDDKACMKALSKRPQLYLTVQKSKMKVLSIIPC